MKNCLIVLVLFSGQFAFAQKSFIEFGAGVGNVLEAEHSAGKGLLFLNGHINLGESLQGGVELGTGGNLLPVDGTGQVLNTQIIVSPYSVRFNTALLKARHNFTKSFGTLFLGLGGGIKHVQNVCALNRNGSSDTSQYNGSCRNWDRLCK